MQRLRTHVKRPRTIAIGVALILCLLLGSAVFNYAANNPDALHITVIQYLSPIPSPDAATPLTPPKVVVDHVLHDRAAIRDLQRVISSSPVPPMFATYNGCSPAEGFYDYELRFLYKGVLVQDVTVDRGGCGFIHVNNSIPLLGAVRCCAYDEFWSAVQRDTGAPAQIYGYPWND